ncbi:MAG: C-terminal helicase domain-containing protein [Nitrososphaera sp.]|jgi:hypothetical protein
MVPYRIEYYRLDVTEEEKKEAEQRAALQKYGLLKRFESSVEAIRKSIGRLLKFYYWFDRALAEGKVLNNKKFHELLTDFEDQDEEVDEDWFAEQIVQIELELAKGLDVKKMQRELKEDIKRLKPLQESLEKIQPWADSKLQELKELFLKDRIFETGGKKVVIFTQFVDTAKYIYSDLTEKLKDKKIDILTGNTKTTARKRILSEFAPKANPPSTKIEKETDISICSDVLSEGQNLQDANYAVNYDLPWNPMKIVQRVGRVDRLTSQHPTVTSAVFFPEKELEELLGLIRKLATKIQKASTTVGVEVSILGEKESPKTFNAMERIRMQDSTLIDDMEQGAELLPFSTPYQVILSYLKKMGEKELKTIPYGKRSGKKTAAESGLVLAYREKSQIDSMHFLFYNYKRAGFEHVGDIAWVFKSIQCKEEEPLAMPLEGITLFQHLKEIDRRAREEILVAVNAPHEAKKAVKIKAKNQELLVLLLMDLFNSAKATRDEILPTYQLLMSGSYSAWDKEFGEIYEKYQQDQSIPNLIASLNRLFEQYKVKSRAATLRRKVQPDDLEMVGCMYLANPTYKDWSLMTF